MPRKPTFPPYPARSHGGSGQARIRLFGRAVYLGVWGSPASHERYNQLRQQWVASQKTGQPLSAAAPLTPLVRDVVARFLAWLEANATARGRELEQARSAVRPLLERHGADLAGAFDAEKLEALRDTFPERGWNQTTSNRHLSRLKRLWKWAERKKLVPPGAAAHLTVVKGFPPGHPRVKPPRTRRLPTEAEVWRVAAQMPGPAGAALRLLWLTGMRTTECLILRPCDIDRAGDVWVYRPHFHKLDRTGQERLVFLGLRCQELLTPLLEGCAAEAWVFRARGGVRYRPVTLGRALRIACARTGVEHFAAYSCRHAAAMRFSRAGGLRLAGELLGQKDLETTSGYTRLDLESATEAARKLA